MVVLLVVVLAGPAETLAGKYPGHAPEYRKLYPPAPVLRPAPLPQNVAALCRLVESGHGEAEIYAALGEALLRAGDQALAYRAFDKARDLARGAALKERIERRLAACTFVPAGVIATEERDARYWVENLQHYERERIARGEDPRDRGPFYERFGRPEEDVRLFVRRRRDSWAWGVGGILLGIAAAAGSFRLSRRLALLPLLVGAWCLAAPSLLGQVGLYYAGAGVSLAGGALLGLLGRRRR